jgi:hypothetical protein
MEPKIPSDGGVSLKTFERDYGLPFIEAILCRVDGHINIEASRYLARISVFLPVKS